MPKPQHPIAESKPEHVECPKCGETLVRVNAAKGQPDLIEVASGDTHTCWKDLPEEADHIRLD